jgi:putative Mn2+ efflux pump MntP
LTVYELILIAVGLSMDAFAVAVACSISLQRVSKRQIFRFGFHFGLFQALMPVIGWNLGRVAVEFVAAWDHWLAFGLLVFVGGKAIYEAIWGDEEDEKKNADPTRGWSLVMLSFATSIDALAVGLSLAMLGEAIYQPALVIGLITGTLTTIGMLLGSRVGARFGKGMEILGGVILIGIGLKILLGSLLSSAA